MFFMFKTSGAAMIRLRATENDLSVFICGRYFNLGVSCVTSVIRG